MKTAGIIATPATLSSALARQPGGLEEGASTERLIKPEDARTELQAPHRLLLAPTAPLSDVERGLVMSFLPPNTA